MRKFYFSWAMILMLDTGTGWCQPVSPFIVNATGGSYKVPNQDVYIDWNVAEMTLVSTIESSPAMHGIYVITNGLLQNNKQSNEAAPRIAFDSSAYLPANSIRVFPNPAASYLEVQFSIPEGGKARLFLYDMNGLQVYARELTVSKGNTLQIPMGNFASGTYFLRVLVNSANGQPKKQAGYKIVKL